MDEREITRFEPLLPREGSQRGAQSFGFGFARLRTEVRRCFGWFSTAVFRGFVGRRCDVPLARAVVFVGIGAIGTGGVGPDRASKVGVDQVGTGEVGVDKIGALEVGVAEVCSLEIHILKVGHMEARTFEVGVVKFPASKDFSTEFLAVPDAIAQMAFVVEIALVLYAIAIDVVVAGVAYTIFVKVILRCLGIFWTGILRVGDTVLVVVADPVSLFVLLHGAHGRERVGRGCPAAKRREPQAEVVYLWTGQIHIILGWFCIGGKERTPCDCAAQPHDTCNFEYSGEVKRLHENHLVRSVLFLLISRRRQGKFSRVEMVVRLPKYLERTCFSFGTQLGCAGFWLGRALCFVGGALKKAHGGVGWVWARFVRGKVYRAG